MGSSLQKKRYYQRPDVASSYYAFRYGTTSGKLVFAKETENIRQIIGQPKTILDVPCGTGRLFSALKHSCKVTGLDTSSAMLRLAKQSPYQKLLQGNASSFPFKDSNFDAVVSLRFFFHFKDIMPFLKEFKRVTKKDGIIVFETLNWSVRSIGFPLWDFLGGRIYVHNKKEIASLCRKLGLVILERKDSFLLTPFMYKYLPSFFTKVLFSLERFFSPLLAVSYWKVKKSTKQ